MGACAYYHSSFNASTRFDFRTPARIRAVAVEALRNCWRRSLSAYVHAVTALLVPLMALGGGCASVETEATPQKVSGPSSMTAPIAARAHIIQAAWPGEAARVVTGSAVMLDA